MMFLHMAAINLAQKWRKLKGPEYPTQSIVPEFKLNSSNNEE